ncbi:MAG: hypothetical protein SF172_10730 [Burkholderiales bacterium]|nr:hypothetical protein [Burkholderiales bacterium]
MALYASRILRLSIEKLRDHSVSQVLFLSGSSPAFVDRSGTHYIDLGELSSERIGEIHELCRMVADDPVEESDQDSTYTFVLRHIGRVCCTFRRRGDAASLVVVRDSDAVESVGAIRPRRLPALRAEAKPDTEANPKDD